MENPESELLELRKFRGVCSPSFSLHVGSNRIPLPLQINELNGPLIMRPTKRLSQGRLQGEISEDLLKYDLRNTYEVVDNSNHLSVFTTPQVIPQRQV
jgi:hypothetical protein